MRWSQYYPAFEARIGGHGSSVTDLTKNVTVADIGCGFGGLLIALSPILASEYILGGLISQLTPILLR